MHEEIIKSLGNDDQYYGEMGRKYLSNSDIGILLSNPAMFKQPSEKTVAMVRGTYFHQLLLEPEKAEATMIVSASSRNTNIYKDQAKGDILLLEAEAKEVREMVDTMKGNYDFYEEIYDERNKFEVPAIKMIMGNMWKGKADIVGVDLVTDAKTTSKIDDFKYSAKKYNYDSQAWVYNQLFGKPVQFFVIEGGTNRMAKFDCSDEFLDSGKAKVERATEVYEKFFGSNKTHDINQYYKIDTL